MDHLDVSSDIMSFIFLYYFLNAALSHVFEPGALYVCAPRKEYQPQRDSNPIPPEH